MCGDVCCCCSCCSLKIVLKIFSLLITIRYIKMLAAFVPGLADTNVAHFIPLVFDY